VNIRLFLSVLLLITLILAIPFVAIQFTNEVNWDLMDFIVAGTLLFWLGILCGYIFFKVHGREKKMTIIILIVLVFILVFMELAVGIFGTWFAGS